MLEPGPDRETFVEDQPDERAHLPWARVVLKSNRHLSGRGVPKVEVKKEGLHVGCVVQFAYVGVTPLGDVFVEGGVAQGRDWQPVPFSGVPR